ncbi:BglG family transcription antiterminator [Amedibacillus dolichus]|uniref:PRD domain protein n=1 Tax=Amedibacillus dolichus DSM 3991 TaxID=428127 RepID=A8RA27_9FIRM|nr:PRD domain-containing protein [Amedibacillus dolichus]EDP11509.1 PRD domain protein [Amedibacillus dolichus DSM 3991]
MLIKRQISILLEMSNQVGEYYKANHFSDKFNVSLRTVQNDLKAIKEETLMYKNDFIIESKVPFGTRIIVMHNEKFKQFINDLKLQSDEFNTNDRDDRIYKLLNFLLDQRKSISITKCADYIFVSKSTLMLDLKELETIISKYSLRLIQSKGYLWIDGLERDKRICLMDNNYAYLSVLPTNLITGSETGHISFIHNLLINELLHKQYPISDVEFQNLILWLNISIRRIGSFFYLNEEDINDDITHSVEIEIARNIFERIETKYLLRVPQTEINFLAMYINNHSNFRNTDYISEDLNEFILYALEKIKESYPTDFLHDVNLRMSLALHLVPLISRAKNNVQIKNEMLDYIKQSFPYAFDIATYFSYLLSERYNCLIKESETAFLAIYFNKSINDYAVLKGNKRLCIITNLKRSEYFLLEQLLYDQFRKYIADITFVSSQELEKIDLDAFDLFFSTEDNKATEVGLATKLTFFPDASELQKIKVRIEGFKNVEDIIRLFDPRLFFRAEIPAKEKVQKKLVKTASQLYQIENLYEEIELREEFGSTYFGNGVAILHPMHLITNESFIGEIVLKKPIPWDNDGNYVNLVFLVCIQKNNLEAFRAWDYLSPLLFNNQFKQEVLEVENYEHFKQVLEANLKSNIL